MSILFKLALLAVLGTVGVGAWLGGEMVYAHNIGPEGKPTTIPTSFPSDLAQTANMAADALNPEQMHVTMAGLAIAVACVCLGLSIRASHPPSVPVENEAEHVSRIAAAFSDDVTRRSDTALLREEELAAGLPDRRPKPARFWFLATLLVILTVAGGIWTLAHEMGTWNLKTLRDTITETDGPALTRRLAHVITGVVILADTLVLAVMALMRSRSRLMLAIFASPLILAIAIQIWLGILLVLDGPAGVVTRFQN